MSSVQTFRFKGRFSEVVISAPDLVFSDGYRSGVDDPPMTPTKSFLFPLYSFFMLEQVFLWL